MNTQATDQASNKALSNANKNFKKREKKRLQKPALPQPATRNERRDSDRADIKGSTININSSSNSHSSNNRLSNNNSNNTLRNGEFPSKRSNFGKPYSTTNNNSSNNNNNNNNNRHTENINNDKQNFIDHDVAVINQKLKQNVTRGVPLLLHLTASKLADRFVKDPTNCLVELKDIPDLLFQEISKRISPFNLDYWNKVYLTNCHPTQRITYFELMQKIEQFEGAYEFVCSLSAEEWQNCLNATDNNSNSNNNNNSNINNGSINSNTSNTDQLIVTITNGEGKSMEIPTKFQSPLIDVYEQYETFVLMPRTNQDIKMKTIFFCDNPPDLPSSGGKPVPSIVPKKKFLERFHMFTNNVFSAWNEWQNMFVLGGAVFASLVPVPVHYTNTPGYYYQFKGFPSSDIDIYLYGLSPEKVLEKIRRFHDFLRKTHKEVLVVNTKLTITFVCGYPTRHIQFVLGKWNSIGEVLIRPDVDCSCVAFDGTRVYATHRSRLSLNKRLILASQKRYQLRGHKEYESRLVKYSYKGFSIVDAALKNWQQVNDESIEEIAKELKRLERIAPNTGGLRCLLAGFRHPELRQIVDVLRPPAFKTTGLVYGPQSDLAMLRKLINRGYVKEGTYDGHNVPTTCKLVELDELETVELHTTKDVDGCPQWHAGVFKEQPMTE